MRKLVLFIFDIYDYDYDNDGRSNLNSRNLSTDLQECLDWR